MKSKTAGAAYKAARGNLLAMLVLTAVNTLLALTGSDRYYLFTDFAAYIWAAFARGFYDFTGEAKWLVLGAAGAVLVMAVYFLCWLLSKKRRGWLTAALVSQVKIPYEYAFMFTSALRFMPDFIAESHAVREAQICRGYVQSRNPLKRIVAYAALVEPMVLRAITRSDTMAMSLELRGFGSTRRTFTQQIAFQTRDYLMLAFLVVVTVLLILYR